MTTTRIYTTVAIGNANATFVSFGSDNAAMHSTVAIVGEDVHLIVVLVRLTLPLGSNIYFMNSGRGRVETKELSVWRP